jgi:hypothetical protein
VLRVEGGDAFDTASSFNYNLCFSDDHGCISGVRNLSKVRYRFVFQHSNQGHSSLHLNNRSTQPSLHRTSHQSAEGRAYRYSLPSFTSRQHSSLLSYGLRQPAGSDDCGETRSQAEDSLSANPVSRCGIEQSRAWRVWSSEVTFSNHRKQILQRQQPGNYIHDVSVDLPNRLDLSDLLDLQPPRLTPERHRPLDFHRYYTYATQLPLLRTTPASVDQVRPRLAHGIPRPKLQDLPQRHRRRSHHLQDP